MFSAAEVHLLDTGHFALKTHAEEIAKPILKFLGELLRQEQVKLECVRYSEEHPSSVMARPSSAMARRYAHFAAGRPARCSGGCVRAQR